MSESVVEIGSIDELANFVHHKLCERENLLSDQFVTHSVDLQRRGECCGLQFQLQGPRSVRLSAVWAADQNCVYFYDTQGERDPKVRLLTRLVPQQRAA